MNCKLCFLTVILQFNMVLDIACPAHMVLILFVEVLKKGLKKSKIWA